MPFPVKSRGDWFLPEHGGEVRFDGLGPDAIAGGGGMQEIAHRVLGYPAVRLDEEVADVAEEVLVPQVRFSSRISSSKEGEGAGAR